MWLGLLVKWGLVLLPLEPKPRRALLWVDLVWTDSSAGFVWKGIAVLALRLFWPGRAVLPECRGVGSNVNSLGSQCRPCAFNLRCSTLEVGEGNCSSHLLFLGRGVSMLVALRESLLEDWIISALCVPGILQPLFSSSPTLGYLSLHDQHTAFRTLSQPSLLTF